MDCFTTCVQKNPMGRGWKTCVILSFKLNSIRLGGPAHGIVTKTVHKTLPGGVGSRGGGQGVEGGRGW